MTSSDVEIQIGVSNPQFADVDVFGLTHPGKVRQHNEDHYFVGSLSRGILVHNTSLELPRIVEAERLASFAIVADGVGSGGGGEEASRLSVQALVRQVSKNFHEASVSEATEPDTFTRLLSDAALQCHEALLERSAQDPSKTRFATTLTLFLGLWPHAYLLQLGDSRCYLFRDGVLTQISRDQTMAQDLVDQGVMTQTKAMNTQFAHILSSAIGGRQAEPVVSRIVRDWGNVVLLCSDGLTKHVSDERIKERIEQMTSARQLCEALVQDALDDGGTDNITIVVGRTLRRVGK
jgi:PPM family protein phosphatase